MNASDVVISEWAEELCERWRVSREELAQARVDGSVLFDESAIEAGRVVIWSRQRPDGTYLYIVCGPQPHIINDFRPLRRKPSYDHLPIPLWPA